jgi:proteasome lid subunit RPN8/RPN11/cell division protein FtsB
MEDTFDIEISEQNRETAGAVQLPLNFLTVGEIENDDVKVYIKQDVYKALEKYALADVEHERGTIILGDFHDELGKTHVVISNYIEARYTDASASTLTFTHETWDYVHREQDAKYPDKRIVGWQHTHPGYGIFLSNYDLFIHENFFNLPFQVAYVIDPVQNLRGFFQWKNGKVEKLNGFYIYDDVGKPIKIEQARKTAAAADEPETKSGWLSKAALLLALLIAVGSLLTCFRLRNALHDQQQVIEAQNSKQQQLEQAIADQNESIENIRSTIIINNDAGEPVEQTVTITELVEMLEAQQSTIDNQQKIIEELKASVQALEENAELQQDGYILYTVEPGDTLGAICARLGIDYWKNKGVILELNRIKDENVILTGQVLLFPAYMKAG